MMRPVSYNSQNIVCNTNKINELTDRVKKLEQDVEALEPETFESVTVHGPNKISLKARGDTGQTFVFEASFQGVAPDIVFELVGEYSGGEIGRAHV